ncbi:FadR/GntR family transcriptional regulator [Actinomadura vinacea]|uniref:FadR/GntR family transcriptional regulator n=1 Tax=Actinomadura vinacea TaxID=115336 RepID=A0ABP5X2G9_9ACTN
MTLRTARRSSLVEQVIDQLRDEIATGVWPVGAKIPPEPVLSENLGVGRNTVREAVRALTHAGLLECRQGDGTYVRATSELSGAVRRRLQTAELIEILQVRRGFEVEAARLAAAHRTGADMAAIDDALARRDAAWAAGAHAEFVEADTAFHTAVVEATHNRVLIELYRDFGAGLRASIGAAGPGPRQADVPHGPIAAAIKAGDAEAAAQAARSCLDGIIRSAETRPPAPS